MVTDYLCKYRLAFARIPLEQPKTMLDPRNTFTAITRKEHFIYNPRLKSAAAAQVTILSILVKVSDLSKHKQALVVQNESLEFVLTLQNPFMFDLELPSVVLR